jgi:UDP:flavonoid glycosyltransferase YjiC (YdhE family)
MPELLDFLRGGSAPVYIGFGSMSSEKPEETMRLILDALAVHNRRAIVHSGWAGLASASVPNNVLVIGSVPHSWLFSRVSAIVHHGGAGTTAAAIRAGAPSIVVPFHGDQPFWADLTYRLGVGTRPIPRRRLTGERLATAIESSLEDGELIREAAELGDRVRKEDGVTKAVEVIASTLH